jgi:hypothetical protein
VRSGEFSRERVLKWSYMILDRALTHGYDIEALPVVS